MGEDFSQSELMLSMILGIYALIPAFILIAGIVTWVIGGNKESKNLKLAGIVITILGAKILVIIGLIYLYMKFILGLSV
jgi:hypothetical protein